MFKISQMRVQDFEHVLAADIHWRCAPQGRARACAGVACDVAVVVATSVAASSRPVSLEATRRALHSAFISCIAAWLSTKEALRSPQMRARHCNLEPFRSSAAERLPAESLRVHQCSTMPAGCSIRNPENSPNFLNTVVLPITRGCHVTLAQKPRASRSRYLHKMRWYIIQCEVFRVHHCHAVLQISRVFGNTTVVRSKGT